MLYAVSENRGLAMEKCKGTDKFLDPLIVQGPYASYEEAESKYGRKLNSIMGSCAIMEVHASQLSTLFAWRKRCNESISGGNAATGRPPGCDRIG